MKKIRCDLVVGMLVFFRSIVEAQVCPLIPTSVVTFVSVVTKIPIVCFHLIYKYLYGDKFVGRFSIYLTQWKYLRLYVEDHGL